jgi:hypothetical protein
MSKSLLFIFIPSKISRNPILWKQLCHKTGKHKAPEEAQLQSIKNYRNVYRSIPCVPLDLPSIKVALDYIPSGGVITLLPGIYEERVVIDKSVTIQAVDRVKGAAILYDDMDDRDTSAIEIVDDAVVHIHNLTVLHASGGSDIWNGNCAIFCRGFISQSHVALHGCRIQSDSGRGVVVGSTLEMKGCTVQDCAATGLYIGSELGSKDSFANISGCFFLRNGFGPPVAEDGSPRFESDLPSGHSGIFIDASKVKIQDSLIAYNSSAGMSIVGEGQAEIQTSEIRQERDRMIVVVDDLDAQIDLTNATFIQTEQSEYMPDSDYEDTYLSRLIPTEPLSTPTLEAVYGTNAKVHVD